MKPFTPRIRIRFITAGFVSFSFPDFEEAQDFTIAAEREPLALVLIRSQRAWRGRALLEAGLVDEETLAERAREGGRPGAHEVMDLLPALRPVDAPFLGPAPAVVATAREIVRQEGHLARHEPRQAALD